MVSDIPDSEVGKVNSGNAFALPFIFPSKKDQKLLINAQSLTQSARQGTTIGRNPTPLLQDGMNGFSSSTILPPNIALFSGGKSKGLRLPEAGAVFMMPTPQSGYML
jgi:hypothetical protein